MRGSIAMDLFWVSDAEAVDVQADFCHSPICACSAPTQNGQTGKNERLLVITRQMPAARCNIPRDKHARSWSSPREISHGFLPPIHCKSVRE